MFLAVNALSVLRADRVLFKVNVLKAVAVAIVYELREPTVALIGAINEFVYVMVKELNCANATALLKR